MEVDVTWLHMYLLLKTLAAVNGRLDVNVALNRPAYQTNLLYFDTYGIYPADLANDGNHYTNMWEIKTCAVINTVMNPWWAVDLLVPLHVHGVKFTNRNAWGYRSDNFVVGLTNVSPLDTAPTLWNYAVCGQYPGAVADSATVNLQCTSCMPAYRYVIVQFPMLDSANFCEVEVYIRRWEYAKHPGQKMINKVASTFQVDRRVSCLANCTVSPICDSYNYRPSDKTCQFNTHDTPLIANSTDIVSDNAWTWWSPIFCSVV